jgi:hypothetical protein
MPLIGCPDGIRSESGALGAAATLPVRVRSARGAKSKAAFRRHTKRRRAAPAVAVGCLRMVRRSRPRAELVKVVAVTADWGRPHCRGVAQSYPGPSRRTPPLACPLVPLALLLLGYGPFTTQPF